MMSRNKICTASALLLLCLFLLCGCVTPIGVNAVSPRVSYNDAYANPLNAGVLSDQAKFVLNRHFLLDTYAGDPAAAIAALHDKALHDDRRDILYALAEASYLSTAANWLKRVNCPLTVSLMNRRSGRTVPVLRLSRRS